LISTIVKTLISPLGTSLVLIIISAIVLTTQYRKYAVFIVLISFAWLFIWSMPVSSQWLHAKITADYPPKLVESFNKADAIVVLGGAVSAPNSYRLYPDMNSSADRVWFGARLHHAGKAPLVVLTGGVNERVTNFSEAEAMQSLIIDLGVKSTDILLERKSRNTHQNATFTRKLLNGSGINKILLVTSALHMPRAVKEFRQVGFDVIAAPTDHDMVCSSDWQSFLPNSAALDQSTKAFKELIGSLVV
jgi:uncharacterized SAM-binding protein YcdF (DUF218 family)